MTTDADPQAAGGRVEARIFLVIGAFLGALGLVYLVTSREEAGTALLLVAGAFGAMVGGYLTLQSRATVDPAAGEQPEAYLPHASIWPFGIGTGAVLAVSGLAFGLWAILPGLALSAGSTYGLLRQSRRRD